eukprot:gene2133-2328_t
MSLVQEVLGFIRSLRLQDKLSPRRNPEIIWAYLFFPAFIAYLVLLTGYINEKPSLGEIVVLDASLNTIIYPSSKIEIISSGFNWTEGPLWIQDDASSSSHLVFSDTVQNAIYKWEEGKGMFTVGKTLYVQYSGCRNVSGHCATLYEPGTNGLVRRSDSSLDLLACSHGERSIVFLRENGTRSAVVNQYKGKRLNSPNDLVWSPDGHLYFTDPDFGLQDLDKNIQNKDLEHNGVYMVKADFLNLALEMGEPTAYVRLVEGRLSMPNGLAFSPDFAKLYVANSDRDSPIVNVYDVEDDGSLKNGRVFFDFASDIQKGSKGLPDGVKVDINGNVYVAGPGGVHIISPNGLRLGIISVPDKLVSNLAFGGDGKLYITATDSVLRVAIRSKPARILKKLR